MSSKAYKSWKANDDAIDEEKSRLVDNPIQVKKGEIVTYKTSDRILIIHRIFKGRGRNT